MKNPTMNLTEWSLLILLSVVWGGSFFFNEIILPRTAAFFPGPWTNSFCSGCTYRHCVYHRKENAVFGWCVGFLRRHWRI